MSNDPREQHAKFQATVEDDNFAFNLINEVIKAFLAASEPKVQVFMISWIHLVSVLQ